MQRKFDKFYKTSMMIMVAIIIWLLWRCCGGIGGGGQCDAIGAVGAGPGQNTIVYVPMYAPLADPDSIPMNQPKACEPQDIQRFKERGMTGVLPCNGAPTGLYQFDEPTNFEQQFGPGAGFYDTPGSLGDPVEVSAPVTLYLFVGAIATIIVLRLFRK